MSEVSEDDSRASSPRLHPAHTQKPKTTTVAEVDRDLFTGNKYINEYEILGEIGRGQHGKVKLGRRLGEEWKVAIKIVPRYSKKRRLGKLSAVDNEIEDETRKEVAILKKARHPNVVGLYEVIDDPSKNKVYLVLEYVELGEIKWRKDAPAEILGIQKARFEREKKGIPQDLLPLRTEQVAVDHARRRHEQLEERTRSGAMTPIQSWSLEHSADVDEDTGSVDLSGSVSSHRLDADLVGSMFGPYAPDDSLLRHRAGSLAESAASHMSSEFQFEDRDDQFAYVPALTFEEIRRALRDTALGVEFLHFLGIIHRDIKPMNLLVTSKGDVKISDFGVSYLGRPVSDEEEIRMPESEAEPLDDERELAKTVGTPAFWAPELCYNSLDPQQAAIFEVNGVPKIGPALDLWSLGVTLYTMVYARLPFYETPDMSLYEAICKSEVFLPKTRLKPVDTTSPALHSRVSHPINSNKRLDYDLEFEEVPAALRDLIRKLLIKDPAKRMTIAQLKKHSWVLEGIEDPSRWAEFTNPGKKTTASAILEVDEKEMSRAVVKRSFVERSISAVKGFAGSLLGRKESRRRAASAATSTSVSSESIASHSTSSGSTVGKKDNHKEGRNANHRGDEIVPALKASRENTEHPLAQSQTASPVETNRSSYFAESTAAEPASPGSSPVVDHELRPRGPHRTVSSTSEGESVKTIKAPLPMKRPTLLEQPEEMEPSTLLEAVIGRLNFATGTAKNAKRLTGLSGREQSSGQRSSSTSRKSSESNAYAEPSVAISTAVARGDFEAPHELRDDPPVVHSPNSSASPISPSSEGRFSKFQPPESSDAAFEHAQEINRRRQIQEKRIEFEKALEEAELRATPRDCPPSPDDLNYGHSLPPPTQENHSGGPMPTLPSASTLASSEGFGTSSRSQSISDPSIGVISSASSPPNGHYLSPEKARPPANAADEMPEFMRTNDTVTAHDYPPVATGAPLEKEMGNDDADTDEFDDSSDDEGIVMMGGPRRS